MERKRETAFAGRDLATAAAEIAARSHIGCVRQTNQDRHWLHAPDADSVLLAVADGLGGDPYGELAAEMVLEGLAQAVFAGQGQEERQLQEQALRLDRFIAQAAGCGAERGAMGSTLVLVHLRAGRAWWVHVGDSRLYLLRGGIISQVTQDQTLARFLLSEGEITAEEARGHYSCLIPDQYLGCGYCEPETGSLELWPGDTLLLASDGLHRFVAPEAIAAAMDGAGTAGAKAEALVRAALAAGGEDNITAVVALITRS